MRNQRLKCIDSKFPKGAKDIPGLNGRYRATKIGTIWSYCNNKPHRVKPIRAGQGYLAVGIAEKQGEPLTRYYVHRLIATTFIGDPAPGMQVNHKNRIISDNRCSNLEWVTRRENYNHAKANGAYGNKKRVLNKKLVMEIRANYTTGSGPEMAKKYNIGRPHLLSIVKRRSWRGVS